MKRVVIVFLVGLLLASACAPKVTNIEASNVWARTGMMGGNSAIYMMLANGTDIDDELLGASSDVAGAVELHLSKMGDNGEMMMIQQSSVPLAAGEKVDFKPGGLHIMLIGLNQELEVGDQFEVILHFKNHDDVILTVIVKEGMQMDM